MWSFTGWGSAWSCVLTPPPPWSAITISSECSLSSANTPMAASTSTAAARYCVDIQPCACPAWSQSLKYTKTRPVDCVNARPRAARATSRARRPADRYLPSPAALVSAHRTARSAGSSSLATTWLDTPPRVSSRASGRSVGSRVRNPSPGSINPCVFGATPVASDASAATVRLGRIVLARSAVVYVRDRASSDGLERYEAAGLGSRRQNADVGARIGVRELAAIEKANLPNPGQVCQQP